MNDQNAPPESADKSRLGADPGEGETGAADRYDELESILDALRTRATDAPQWEFCEGFMVALLCCRRPIAIDEYLPVLLGSDEQAQGAETSIDAMAAIPFSDDAQRARFLELWNARCSEVAAALDAEVETLDDERAYHPQLFDMRGLVARMDEAERADINADELPAFAQLWALGFMEVVDLWSEEWVPPRDKEARKLIAQSLDAIGGLMEDDEAAPDVSPFDDADPPSVSRRRFDAFGLALWGVYDLHDVWKSFGPRIDPVKKADVPGRNDPCPCGSGKKFKKCCG